MGRGGLLPPWQLRPQTELEPARWVRDCQEGAPETPGVRAGERGGHSLGVGRGDGVTCGVPPGSRRGSGAGSPAGGFLLSEQVGSPCSQARSRSRSCLRQLRRAPTRWSPQPGSSAPGPPIPSLTGLEPSWAPRIPLIFPRAAKRGGKRLRADTALFCPCSSFGGQLRLLLLLRP